MARRAGGFSEGDERTRTLRRVLVGAAALLGLLVLFYGYLAHRRATNYLAGLPKHLGIDIQQEANSFTYSQSSRGKKLFTVHATKEIQHKDGKVTLHDVGIVLYGRNGEASDRIHGTDFEYDAKQQKMTAQGEVYIDLVPPAKTSNEGGRDEAADAADSESRMIHVKTIGLLFDQKEELASSEGAVEFRTGAFSGSAVGASYDAKSGEIVLQQAVHISGIRNDRPTVLTAAHAALHRQRNVVELESARYVSAGDGETQTAEAGHANVRIEQDGTPEQVDAEGGVRLTAGERGALRSRRMQLLLNASGQAKDAHFMEAVHYASSAGTRQNKADAAEMRVAFDGQGRATRALLTGGVHVVEQSPSAMKTLESGTLDLALSGGGKTPSIVRGAQAQGPNGARMRMAEETAAGRSLTDVQADHLSGRFAENGKATELLGVDGTGHSMVERVVMNPRGSTLSKEGSTGDLLKLDLAPQPDGRSQLTRAEQHGNVRSTREAVPAKGGASDVEHGRADNLVYEAATEMVHMTGSAEVQDDTSALAADRLDINRVSGDAQANGSVRVTYLDAGPAEGGGARHAEGSSQPVHVLAARGIAHRSSGVVDFFGDASGDARLWQGGSVVEAPELEFFRTEKRLIAHGPAGSDKPQVHAVLVNAAPPRDAPASGHAAANRPQAPLRIRSREMIYEDGTRSVHFEGGVRVQEADGTLTAEAATTWLSAPAAGGPGKSDATSSAPLSAFSGKVDHMIATGSVVLTQPGRRATGEKLVYTAAEELYLLTGSKSDPPRVTDAAQGTTTGAALRFRAGEESVQVLGSEAGTTAGRVRSETRVRQ